MTKKARQRPRLPVVSEQMKAWSAALADEIGGWPQVTTRSFFGFNALYRRNKIFALLPLTRGMHTPNSLAFKLESPSRAALSRLQREPRIDSSHVQKGKWFAFALSSDADLRDALDWLGRAYDAAGKSESSK